jgi:hypothetical protein
LLAIPIGYAIGMAVKDALLVTFLLPRVRSIGRTPPVEAPATEGDLADEAV